MSCPNHDIDAGGNCRACGYNSDIAYAEALARGEDVYGYVPEVSDEDRAAWEAEQERDAALDREWRARQALRDSESRHYIALIGGSHAYVKLTPTLADSFAGQGPNEPIEFGPESNRWYPVSAAIAEEWTAEEFES